LLPLNGSTGGARLGCQSAASIAPELHATTLRSCKRSLGASRDHPALLVGDHGHNADGEAVRMRHVGRHEINSGLL
jgi:hypothetical protein